MFTLVLPSPGVLELDFAIDRDGLVAPSHAARYKQLGDYIASCYGSDNVAAMAIGNPGQDSITLAVLPRNVDRVVLQVACLRAQYAMPSTKIDAKY